MNYVAKNGWVLPFHIPSFDDMSMNDKDCITTYGLLLIWGIVHAIEGGHF